MHNKFTGITSNEMLDMLENGSPNERAAAVVLQYGMIGGAHHKQWVLDQALRIITGERYAEIIEVFNSEDGFAKWDVGVAP